MAKKVLPPVISRLRVSLAKFLGAGIAALALCMATGSIAQTVEAQVNQQQGQAVNINQAGVDELATLAGIGEGKAQAIIDYRDAHGAFASVDQLTEVKGIGEATVDKNRARIGL